MFAVGGGYFVVIGDLFVVKGYWLVGGNSLFITGHLGNELEKSSGVLGVLVGLYPSPPILSTVFGYRFGYQSFKRISDVAASQGVDSRKKCLPSFWSNIGFGAK